VCALRRRQVRAAHTRPSDTLLASLEQLVDNDAVAASEPSTCTITTAAAAATPPTKWHRVFVSDDGELVLAQPASSRRSNIRKTAKRDGDDDNATSEADPPSDDADPPPPPPLVGSLWLWERSAGDTTAAGVSLSGGSSDGIPVALGAWTPLAPLVSNVVAPSSAHTHTHAYPPVAKLGASSGEGPGSNPTLAVQFFRGEGPGSVGRGCVVAYAFGRLDASGGGGGVVTVAILRQSLRCAEPHPGVAPPRAVWAVRTFALPTDGDGDGNGDGDGDGIPLAAEVRAR